MVLHPHDTDRILGVLGDAIEKLREWQYGYNRTGAIEVANDLALLHGAVSAERDQPKAAWRDPETMEWHGDLSLVAQYPEGFNGPPLYESERRRFLRLVKHEEISDEVARGEHRED